MSRVCCFDDPYADAILEDLGGGDEELDIADSMVLAETRAAERAAARAPRLHERLNAIREKRKGSGAINLSKNEARTACSAMG